MERSIRIPQLYGYAVCLVAIITFLVSISSFVDAAFERSNPLQAQGNGFGYSGTSLTSFDAFQTTYPQQRGMVARPPQGPQPSSADTLSTSEMQRRYEAMKADRLARVSFDSARQMVKHGLLILIAVGLFVVHWRWLRDRAANDRLPA